MESINHKLREKAVSLGLCKEWQGMWNQDFDNDELADMMYRGIDFCIMNRYPSKEFLTDNFSLEFLRDKKIFVNDRRSTNNPENSIAIGKSEVKYRFNGSNSGNIYALDGSNIKVISKNRSFAIVHAFDNSHISAEQYDAAKLIVLRHSPNVSVATVGNVTVKDEFDYLKNK